MKRARNSYRTFSFAPVALATLLPLLSLTSAGCGLLIGNIKPVEEKSDQYGVADLAKDNPKAWTRLSASQQGADVRDPDVTATEVPDVAFQSPKTAAVISINSSCHLIGRGDDAPEPKAAPAEGADGELRTLAKQLTFGISNVTHRTEKTLTIQGSPALQTTLQGRINHNDIALRTVVLRKNGCVYDLLYMAPPAHFAENEADFDHFVASLRLK
jgi:hypothetical protein